VKKIGQFCAVIFTHILLCKLRLGYRSRYSDSLRTGRSEDRIPLDDRLSASVQTGPGAHPSSNTMGTRSVTRV
jgi:hypothetical protein